MYSEKSEPIFEKGSKNLKTFFSFRDMKNDADFLKTTQQVMGFKPRGGTEIIDKKLTYNSKARQLQEDVVRAQVWKSYTKVLSSERAWKEKTRKKPLVIKRRVIGFEHEDDEEEEGDATPATPGDASPKKRASIFADVGLVPSPAPPAGLSALNMPTVEERSLKIKDYVMSWLPKVKQANGVGFSVDVKEGRTCTLLGDSLYMFGGYSPSFNSPAFESFSFASKLMKEVKPRNREPPSRAFHTCNAYEDSLVIFGGEHFARYADSRILTSEVLIFNTKTLEYLKLPNTLTIEPRKHHASAIIGSFLISSGGIDDENKPLPQICVYNMSKFVSPKKPTITPGSLLL